MKNLIELSNEEICEFLLNNKKADALELNADRSEGEDKSGFTQRTVYKDKSMEIVFSFLKIADNDIIQQFFIYSNWWGGIKNSFFTIEGFKGKGDVKCGVINIEDLKPFANNGQSVLINNKNETAKIEVSDFASLVALCQRKYKASPTYETVAVISQTPSLVEIKVTMPDGKQYFEQGASKREAANRFASTFSL